MEKILRVKMLEAEGKKMQDSLNKQLYMTVALKNHFRF